MREKNKIRGEDKRKGGKAVCSPAGWNEYRSVLLYDQIMHFLGHDNSTFAIYSLVRLAKTFLSQMQNLVVILDQQVLPQCPVPPKPSCQTCAHGCSNTSMLHLAAWFRGIFYSDLGNCCVEWGSPATGVTPGAKGGQRVVWAPELQHPELQIFACCRLDPLWIRLNSTSYSRASGTGSRVEHSMLPFHLQPPSHICLPSLQAFAQATLSAWNTHALFFVWLISPPPPRSLRCHALGIALLDSVSSPQCSRGVRGRVGSPSVRSHQSSLILSRTALTTSS